MAYKSVFTLAKECVESLEAGGETGTKAEKISFRHGFYYGHDYPQAEIKKLRSALANLYPFCADALAQVGQLCVADGNFARLNEALIAMKELGIEMPESPYGRKKK